MTTTHEKETMLVEIEHVQRMITTAINEIETEGGSIRFFNAALISAAVALHAQVEGLDSVEAALVKTAKRRLVTDGKASQC